MALACFGLRIVDKTRFKGALYRFLTHVPDVEGEVEQFWARHESKITGPCHPKPGDLIISGSPEFLLRAICESRGWNLIASQVDPHTGRTLGPNCSEHEKVARFRARYPEAHIERFYSDKRKDDPMARIADKAILVSIPKGTLAPWG